MSFQNAKSQIDDFPSQFETGISLAEEVLKNIPFVDKIQKIKNRDEMRESTVLEQIGLRGIVIAGMGGSAYSAEIIQDYFALKNIKVPVFISRDYLLPPFVDDHYLVFVQSYSGNTEETISTFNDCMKKSIIPISITSGGVIAELARKNRTPYIRLPKNWQPRFALGYFLFAELRILAEFFRSIDIKEEMKYLGFVKWDTFEEKGRRLSDKIDKTPLFYSSLKLKSVIKIWKALFNECSKEHCFVNELSEMNHNELVGFTKDVDYFVIIFQDETETYRMKKRISLLQEIFKKKKIKSLVFNVVGGTFLTRVLTSIYVGMWTSIYKAKENGYDPEKIDIIEEFKKKLGKFI